MMFPTLCWYARLCKAFRVWNMSYKFPISYKKSNQANIYIFVFFQGHLFFFYTRAMNGNNLISWAYLQFISNLQNSGILHTSSMIKVIPDPKHVAIPSKVIPLVYINPSFFVSHNLLKSRIGYFNIPRQSTTPLARCTLATLSVNISHKTLNGFHEMLNGLLKTFQAWKLKVCYRVSSI